MSAQRVSIYLHSILQERERIFFFICNIYDARRDRLVACKCFTVLTSLRLLVAQFRYTASGVGVRLSDGHCSVGMRYIDKLEPEKSFSIGTDSFEVVYKLVPV